MASDDTFELVDIADNQRKTMGLRNIGDGSSAYMVEVNNAGSIGGGTQYTEGDTDASVTGTAVLWEDAGDTLRSVSAAKPFPVNIVAGAASGTEYTEGDVDASITGTAVLWEDAGNTLASVSAAKPLPVDLGANNDVTVTTSALPTGAATAAKQDTGNTSLGNIDTKTPALGQAAMVASSPVVIASDQSAVPVSGTFWQATQPVSAASLPLPTGASTGAKQDTGNTSLSSIDGKTPALGQAAMAASSPVVIASDQSAVPVSGTITANAGTNLNTSALALETGGNLAGAATSLAVIDDWDESDRAKVNPIVGQAGVQGASGVVTATTQRVTLATDVALPAGTNAIGKLASNDGVDIGDVTINNASGASAVNIQDGGNSITVDGTVTASNTAGDIAHDSVDSGNPVKVGAKATASLTTQTNVAAADRSNLFTDISGRLVTSPYSVPESLVKGTATLTGTGDTAVIAAGGANIKTYITQITVTNTSGTAVRVDVKDGTTIIWAAYLAASGGGATATFLAPLRGTANTAINAALSAAVTDVRVHVSGYQINN